MVSWSRGSWSRGSWSHVEIIQCGFGLSPVALGGRAKGRPARADRADHLPFIASSLRSTTLKPYRYFGAPHLSESAPSRVRCGVGSIYLG